MIPEVICQDTVSIESFGADEAKQAMLVRVRHEQVV